MTLSSAITATLGLYNGHMKVPYALYWEYEGQTESYTRYKNKTVIMGLLLVMTAAFLWQ